MSANGSAVPHQASEISDKGKGKEVSQDNSDHMMDEDHEDEESEESGAEEVEHPEEEDEDNMEEIDLNNITSSRTRGKDIDWAEAERRAREAGDDMDDEDDEDEDEDFEDPDEEMQG